MSVSYHTQQFLVFSGEGDACFTSFSTLLHLYRRVQFYVWRNLNPLRNSHRCAESHTQTLSLKVVSGTSRHVYISNIYDIPLQSDEKER